MVSQRVFLIVFCLVLSLSLSSCAFLKKTKQQSQLLGELGEISGSVVTKLAADNTVVVSVLAHTDNHVEVFSQKQLHEEETFTFALPPGQYYVLAYVDKNRNLRRDNDEVSVMHRSKISNRFEIVLNALEHKTLVPIELKQRGQMLAVSESYSTIDVKDNTGKIISLASSTFDKKKIRLGFFHPIDFYEQSLGGLMQLAPYDESKIPVIFIHGIMGSPAEFSDIINELDSERFQPWVLYYPTGVPLDLISQYLIDAMHVLHDKYQFEQVQLISHSMGGLVARSYIHKYHRAKKLFDISLYVTINSPLNGMESAANGVESSPIVIASWRDLASGSSFIDELHRTPLPHSIPYHLFFSYFGEDNGDGVVPLRSQLSVSLQNEAKRIYASEASHAGVLRDKQFIQRLNSIINAPNH